MTWSISDSDSSISGTSSVTTYWCSMGANGCTTPAISPTSRAHSPAAFTTCSACTAPFSVTTSQVPSARWARSVTRVSR